MMRRLGVFLLVALAAACSDAERPSADDAYADPPARGVAGATAAIDPSSDWTRSAKDFAGTRFSTLDRMLHVFDLP